MTNRKQQVWLVTSWEFMHFFKWKQEIISKLILVAVALIVMAWQYIKEEKHTVYTVLVPAAQVQLQDTKDFHFVASDKSIEALSAELESTEDWHAILVEDTSAAGTKQITLYSKDKQSWLNDLQAALQQQYTLLYANNLGLAPEQLSVLNQAATFANKYLDSSIKSEDSPAQATAIGMIVLLAVAIFTSFGQLFVSITGEKQQRVTEQLYACITPQTWIDGKILGQMLHSVKAMITTMITAILGYAFVAVILNGKPFSLSLIDWSLLPWLVPFALAGTYLCTAFMAAIAAAIDDPNHSAKTSIMLLPLLPMIITFITMDSPSGWALTFLSFLPITSFVAMPVKMSLIDVPLWHSLISLGLILVVCFWIRGAAARLFKMGMSMYGKEPSYKEMFQWMLSDKATNS